MEGERSDGSGWIEGASRVEEVVNSILRSAKRQLFSSPRLPTDKKRINTRRYFTVNRSTRGIRSKKNEKIGKRKRSIRKMKKEKGREVLSPPL